LTYPFTQVHTEMGLPSTVPVVAGPNLARVVFSVKYFMFYKILLDLL